MKLMFESSIRMYLYKMFCINKHGSSHVDDNVLQTDQIKFSVHFNQEFDLCNITFWQLMIKLQVKIMITLLQICVY